jgi:hypothetical protein
MKSSTSKRYSLLGGGQTLRYALTFQWTAEPWREIRQRVQWLLAEQSRTQRAGSFNWLEVERWNGAPS